MVFTEGMHTAEAIGEMAMGPSYHNDNCTVLTGQVLKAGHVVGKVTIGAKTAVGAAGVPAPAGATITAGPTAAITAKAGVHSFVCIVGGATTTSKWRHIDPDGVLVGVATGNTAYSGGGISGLTITDSGTDPVVSETFTVTVSEAAASGKFVEYNPANTDGSQNVAGIMYGAVDATSADKAGVVTARGPVLAVAANLTWFSGASAPQKATALAALLALGIRAL